MEMPDLLRFTRLTGDLVRAIRGCPQTVVAAIDGVCAGAGAAIAMAADLRFGTERSLALDYIRNLAVKCAGPDAPGGSLSGGNQQKVSLARWLATKPRVLILDEPTQGVDVGAKSEIHKIIRGLAKDGLAVLLISSDLPEVLGMSDRLGVMRGGTLAAIFPAGTDAHTVMAAALGQTEKGAA
jgi:rhamnose transport system ATP-binding protein